MARTITCTDMSITADNEPINAVTFVFSRTDPTKVQFNVPASSKYTIPLHWHTDTSQSGCKKLTCLFGYAHAYVLRNPGYDTDHFIPAGASHAFRPNEIAHRWGADRWGDRRGSDAFVGEIETSDAAHGEVLYRNLVSSTLDARRYADLDSTPYAVRGMLWLLRHLPNVGGVNLETKALDAIQRVQVLAIYKKHDLRILHGRLSPAITAWNIRHFPMLFGDPRPPESWYAFDWRLMVRWARVVDWVVVVLVGRVGLRIKGEYDEYTPAKLEEKVMVDHERVPLLGMEGKETLCSDNKKRD